MNVNKTALSIVASITVVSMIGLSGCEDDKGSSQTRGTINPISTPTPTPTLIPQEKISTITAVDGFLIGSLKNILEAKVGDKTYHSEKTIGKKGLITFKGVNLKSSKEIGTIVCLKGTAKVDANNNGKLDASDKELPIEMSAPSNASVISPLTTLLVEMKKEGVKIPAGFEAAVLNFNPVTQVKNKATQKFVVLNEILKTVMADDGITPAEFTKIDVASVMKAKSLNDLKVDTIVAKLPLSIKAKASAKAKVIQSILPIADGLKPEVDFETLIVSISDGGKNLQEAFHQAAPTLVKSATVDIDTIISSVMRSNLTTESQDYIKKSITTTNASILSIQGNNYTDVKVVEAEPIEEVTSTSTSTSTSTLTPGGGYVSGGGGYTPISANLSIAKATFGDKNVTILDNNRTDMVCELSKSGDSNLSELFNITLIDAKTDNSFTSKDAKLDISIVEDINTSRKLTLTITDIQIEATKPSTFKTTLTTSTHLKFVDDVNGTPKTFGGNISKTITNSDLAFNLDTIIKNSDDESNARAKIKDMENYLQDIPNDRNFTITTTLSGSGFKTFKVTGKGTVTN